MEHKIKWIEGFEGIYDIDTNGVVRSHKRGVIKILKQTITSYGYKKVAIKLPNKKQESALVHRLVANTFIPIEYTDETVDHIDENKHNNNVDNLRWCTRVENLKHYNSNRGRIDRSKYKQEVLDRKAARASKESKIKKYANIEEMVKLTGKKIKINGVEYPSCGTAAGIIVDAEYRLGHNRNKATISKELRRYLQGTRESSTMYGRYKIEPT